jgi:hypothetical protein
MRALLDWRRSPRERCRPFTQLHNIALVPASELASLKKWQERARRLPAGNTLVVIPYDSPQLRQVSKRITRRLRQRGLRSLIVIASHPH